MLHKLTDAYKLWHTHLPNLPRLSRYTLGAKIDLLFTDTIETTLLAAYTVREQKLSILQKANVKLDAIKFFLRLMWEMEKLDHDTYASISAPLGEVGRMIGGWMKDLRQKTPARAGE